MHLIALEYAGGFRMSHTHRAIAMVSWNGLLVLLLPELRIRISERNIVE